MPFSFSFISVAHMNWMGEHHAFDVEMFIKNESIIATQRPFYLCFNLGRHDLIPTKNNFIFAFQVQNCGISIEAKINQSILECQNSGKCDRTKASVSTVFGTESRSQVCQAAQAIQ